MIRAGIVLLFVVATAAPASAAPEDIANDVASEIMSPFCEGVTLHDCPSQAALDLRAQIERWASLGWSKARIVDELENRFGPSIHATPQDSQGLAAWALPAGALLLGVIGLALLAARWSGRGSDEDAAPVDPVDHARVERELAAIREEMP